MKNIEKIRNMSAEELARIFDGTKCDYCIYGDNNEPCGNCVKSIAEWLEQEAEKPKKPTDAELIQAAELLKANCKNQKDCNKCIFSSKVCCKFEYKTPEEWKLLHRKTRKEVLLEKFPNADTESIIDIMCPRSFGISDRGVTCPSDYDDFDCEACWNVPAESEEE